MRINVAVSSLVSLPLIADLAQKKQLNKIYIPKNLLVFEEHLRSQYTQIDIQKCTAGSSISCILELVQHALVKQVHRSV